MKRTLLTAGLAMALLLSVAFPALASDTAPDSAPEAAEGIAESPAKERAESDVRVGVPSAVEFVLNPYRIRVDTPNGPTQDEVISEPQIISSQTPAPLSVMVSATGAPHGEASFAVSPEDFSPDEKSAFLWIEFQNVTDGEEPAWSGEYAGTRNQVLLNGESRPVLELPASVDGEPMKAAFRVFGAAGVPSEGTWTEEDGVDVSLSFEFEVIEDDEAALYGVTFADEEPVEDAEPSEDEEPVEDAEPSEDEEPVEDAKPSGGGASAGYAQASGDAKASEDEEPVEDAEASDDIVTIPDELTPLADTPFANGAQSVDEARPVKKAELSEDAEASVDEELVEDAEPSDDEEPVEDAEPSDDEEPVEDAEASVDEEPVEDAEASDDEEPVEDAEASVDEEPVEDAEPSVDEEPVEDAEASDEM